MKTKVIFYFLFLFFNSGYATVWIHTHSVKPSTDDPYCQSTHMVKINWNATEVNNNYYQIRRTTDSNLNLTTNKQVLSKIYVIDLLGNTVKQVYSGELGEGNHHFVINLKSYPAGMYYCVFETNTGYRKTIKIIKQ